MCCFWNSRMLSIAWKRADCRLFHWIPPQNGKLRTHFECMHQDCIVCLYTHGINGSMNSRIEKKCHLHLASYGDFSKSAFLGGFCESFIIFYAALLIASILFHTKITWQSANCILSWTFFFIGLWSRLIIFCIICGLIQVGRKYTPIIGQTASKIILVHLLSKREKGRKFIPSKKLWPFYWL